MAKKKIPDQLNICIIASRFSLSERTSIHGFLWPIARGLAERGHTITVLSKASLLRQFEIVRDSVRIFYLDHAQETYENFDEAVTTHFIRLHRENPFHLVHSIDSPIYKIARIRQSLGVAVAYDIEVTEMHQLFSILGMAQETLGSLIRTTIAVTYKFLKTYYNKDRKIIRRADGIFVTSPQQRIFLERYYLYPEAKSFVVPYGIEIGDLRPREGSEELRERLNIPKGAKSVVTITDMTNFGELAHLLRAFQQVAIKKSHSRLIIVGYGPLFKEVEFEMLNLALGTRVILTGAVRGSDIPDYIALADVYVNLSSRTTGFEPSMLEAMAQKKVVIGSEVSPMSTILEDGKDGFLIRPADIHSLASLIIEIFTGHLPVEEIGEQARRKATNMFDTAKLVNETIKAYHQILSHRRS